MEKLLALKSGEKLLDIAYVFGHFGRQMVEHEVPVTAIDMALARLKMPYLPARNMEKRLSFWPLMPPTTNC